MTRKFINYTVLITISIFLSLYAYKLTNSSSFNLHGKKYCFIEVINDSLYKVYPISKFNPNYFSSPLYAWTNSTEKFDYIELNSIEEIKNYINLNQLEPTINFNYIIQTNFVIQLFLLIVLMILIAGSAVAYMEGIFDNFFKLYTDPVLNKFINLFKSTTK